jgi:energy-coupling factor transporter transmembrane protein EcfT
VLGNLVGETFGYLLTAAWTGLVLVALGAAFAGRLFVVLGGVAAVLILLGVFSPLEIPVVDLANFVGYVLWSAWLLVFAAVLVRRGARQTSQAARGV